MGRLERDVALSAAGRSVLFRIGIGAPYSHLPIAFTALDCLPTVLSRRLSLLGRHCHFTVDEAITKEAPKQYGVQVAEATTRIWTKRSLIILYSL